jgi:iron(III) transport system permease protein
LNRNYEEAARSQGVNTFQLFYRVQLPMLRIAIGAGAILISLYVLSDFGAVAMLRYTTFTTAIYYQMGSYDNISAAVLSTVLIGITLLILWAEGRSRKSQKYYQTSGTYQSPERLQLGKWKLPALGFVVTVFILSIAIPVGVLIYWSTMGLTSGALNTKFWMYAWNSIMVSGVASIICMFLAMPIIYLKSRYPSFLSRWIDKLAYSGYALPGVIVALGIIFVFNRYIPFLYNTAFLLSIAYIIRFLPQAMQSGEATLSLISPRIDEAAQSLGYRPWKVLFGVILPLIMPGLLAGGALVFVSSIKELPATLLLRPPGFDTLSVRIWVEAGESLYYLAAPAALLVIIISLFPLKWLLNKY